MINFQPIIYSLFALFFMAACGNQGTDQAQQHMTDSVGYRPDTSQKTVEDTNRTSSTSSALSPVSKRKEIVFFPEEEASVPHTEPSVAPEFASLNELYKQLDLPQQSVMIDTDSDTTWTSASGTVFNIKAHSFVTELGKPVQGKVAFQVKEYTSKADFIMGRLSASSGGQMLESGGMFQLTVTAEDGQECKLKKGRKIDMQVPIKNEERKDLQVFYGNHDAQGHVDWKNSGGKIRSSRLPRLKPTLEVLKSSMVIIEEPSATKIEEEYDEDPWASVVFDSKVKTDTVDFEVYVSKRGTIKSTKVMLNKKLCPRVKPQFVRTVRIGISQYHKMVADQIINFKKEYSVSLPGLVRNSFQFNIKPKHFNNSTYGRRDRDSIYKINFQSIYVAKDTLIASTVRRRNMMNALGVKKSLDTSSSAIDINYYALSATQLNWINLDRFYKAKRTVDMRLVNVSPEAEVNLVFTKINSVFRAGSSLAFESIPADEPVVVVAIELRQGKPALAVKKLNTFHGKVNDLVFETMSVAELKKRLETML